MFAVINFLMLFVSLQVENGSCRPINSLKQEIFVSGCQLVKWHVQNMI